MKLDLDAIEKMRVLSCDLATKLKRHKEHLVLERDGVEARIRRIARMLREKQVAK